MAGAAGSPESHRDPRPHAVSEPPLQGAQPVPPAKPASELKARVVSASVLGVVALLATWRGGWPFALLWFAAGLAILVEWTAMTRVEPRRALQGLLGAGLAALLAVYLLRLPFWAGALAAAGTAAAGMVAARRPRDRAWAVGGFACAAVIVLAPTFVRDHPQAGV